MESKNEQIEAEKYFARWILMLQVSQTDAKLRMGVYKLGQIEKNEFASQE